MVHLVSLWTHLDVWSLYHHSHLVNDFLHTFCSLHISSRVLYLCLSPVGGVSLTSLLSHDLHLFILHYLLPFHQRVQLIKTLKCLLMIQ